jgi:chorismate dehydratase
LRELAEQASLATEIGPDECERYLSGLDYALSYRHLEGLTSFFRRLAQHGKLRDGSLAFLDRLGPRTVDGAKSGMKEW